MAAMGAHGTWYISRSIRPVASARASLFPGLHDAPPFPAAFGSNLPQRTIAILT